MSYKIIYPDELYHHGVKGMKWGVRKEYYSTHGKNVNNLRSAEAAVKQARSDNRTARKAYNKAYDKAYNFSSIHPISQFVKKSKNYQKSSDNWRDAINKANASNQAHSDLRAKKKELRAAKKTANDYKRYGTKGEMGKAFASQLNVYKKSYSAAKNASGVRNKAKAFAKTYANTPYREFGLTGTYTTTVKRNFSGKW